MHRTQSRCPSAILAALAENGTRQCVLRHLGQLLVEGRVKISHKAGDDPRKTQKQRRFSLSNRQSEPLHEHLSGISVHLTDFILSI